MLADPALLHKPTSDAARCDRQTLLNALRRGTSLPALSGATEETERTCLLEYADFLLDQEARYCQQ